MQDSGATSSPERHLGFLASVKSMPDRLEGIHYGEDRVEDALARISVAGIIAMAESSIVSLLIITGAEAEIANQSLLTPDISYAVAVLCGIAIVDQILHHRGKLELIGAGVLMSGFMLLSAQVAEVSHHIRELSVGVEALEDSFQVLENEVDQLLEHLGK